MKESTVKWLQLAQPYLMFRVGSFGVTEIAFYDLGEGNLWFEIYIEGKRWAMINGQHVMAYGLENTPVPLNAVARHGL